MKDDENNFADDGINDKNKELNGARDGYSEFEVVRANFSDLTKKKTETKPNQPEAPASSMPEEKRKKNNDSLEFVGEDELADMYEILGRPVEGSGQKAAKKNKSEKSSNTYRVDGKNDIRQIANQKRRSKGGRESSRSPHAILYSIIILFFIAIFAVAAYVYITDYMPNYKRLSYFEQYTELDRDRLYIRYGDALIADSYPPETLNGKLYLPVDFIKTYIDKYIYWDNSLKKLIITTENRVIRMNSEELEYFVNNEPVRLNIPVLTNGGTGYIPADFAAEFYNLMIEHDETYNIVIIDRLDAERWVCNASAHAALRYEPDEQSFIQADIAKDAFLYRFGEAENGFVKVRTSQGLVGYVSEKKLGSRRKLEILPMEEPIYQTPEPKPISGRITVCWDQVTTIEASIHESRRVLDPGVDVLSPTWFSFDETALNGDIINIADKGYVEWAHENNMQVWALITDNFNREVSHAVLSDTKARENAIKQLLAFVSMYELDGINIDFEMVPTEDADNYIQFLRELYPLLKLQGAILSVDMYVPKPFNLYYNRTEVAKTSDYIIIMGYDEHYAGSPESGPVASIGFVEEGIFETLKEASPEKVILGMPLYTRVWREEKISEAEIKLTSRAYSMNAGRVQFDENNAEFEWLENLGCYYAEYTVTEEGNEVTYKLWLEDLRSLEEKLKMARKYNLAGTACWKRGLEAEGTWELIMQYNKFTVGVR